MSTRLISVGGLPIKPCCTFQQPFVTFNPISHSAISEQRKEGCSFRVGQGLRDLPSIGIWRLPSDRGSKKMNLSVKSSVLPDLPLPSEPPPISWKSWILGMMITVVLPFCGHKLGSLIKFTKEVENIVETSEMVVESIENAAKEVEKVADKIADELPNGKLKDAVIFVENVAKETAKDAEFIDGVIDKVEEVGEKIESLTEPVSHQPNGIAKEVTAKE